MTETEIDTLDYETFISRAAQAAARNDPMAGGSHFDAAIAWAHYSANPAHWHRVAVANDAADEWSEGDPIAAMVVDDGPWWVPTVRFADIEPASGGFGLYTMSPWHAADIVALDAVDVYFGDAYELAVSPGEALTGRVQGESEADGWLIPRDDSDGGLPIAYKIFGR